MAGIPGVQHAAEIGHRPRPEKGEGLDDVLWLGYAGLIEVMGKEVK